MCRAFGAPFERPIHPGLTAGLIHWRPFGPHFDSHSRGHYQLNCYVPLGGRTSGKIACRERLGGLLRYYGREAA